MFKVQTREAGDEVILEAEGRLAGAFVAELENCWRSARIGRKVSVDLKNVTCIDRDGRSLLRSMHAEGVRFLRPGLAVQDILEQVIGEGPGHPAPPILS
jgi:hypothetical protein